MSEIVVQEPGQVLTDGTVPAVAWFCLRSQHKHEHIAAEHLRRMGDVEVLTRESASCGRRGWDRRR